MVGSPLKGGRAPKVVRVFRSGEWAGAQGIGGVVDLRDTVDSGVGGQGPVIRVPPPLGGMVVHVCPRLIKGRVGRWVGVVAVRGVRASCSKGSSMPRGADFGSV